MASEECAVARRYVFGGSIVGVLVILLLGIWPGALLNLLQTAVPSLMPNITALLSMSFTPIYGVFVFLALFLAAMIYNSFLETGFLRTLWFGNAFFMFAVFMGLLLSPTDANAMHAFLAFSTLIPPAMFFHAYRTKGILAKDRRAGLMVSSIVISVLVGVAVYVWGAMGTPFTTWMVGTQLTLEFELLTGAAAILYMVAAVALFAIHLRTDSIVYLSLASACIWFAGAAAGFAQAMYHTDKWHYIGPFMQLIGFLIVFACFLRVYGKFSKLLVVEKTRNGNGSKLYLVPGFGIRL